MPDYPIGHTIVIIGAGYSGALAAVNLLREGRGRKLRIVLIDRSTTFARGLAYGCHDDTLLLNVPAGNMSALADDSSHFLRYCQSVDPLLDSGSFVSRRIYGDYLTQMLAEAEAENPGVLERIVGEALAVRPAGKGGFEVVLSDGRSMQAAQVVLAQGHAPPKPPWLAHGRPTDDGFIGNPWDDEALARIPKTASVAILGTGHTAIDTLLRLAAADGKRKFLLLSRRGLLPHAHRPLPKQPTASSFPAYLQATSATLRAYLHALRAEARQHHAAGGDWRDVINALRPHIPELWQRLPLAERLRFLRHASSYWDIHRHRLAPSAHAALHALLDAGRAQVVAGRVLAYERQGEGVRLMVKERRSAIIRELTAEAVVNCTGPNYDIGTHAVPLIHQLVNVGLLQADTLRLGVEVDDRYRLIDRNGAAVEGLYYLGPMLRARYWEATAVPELRGHAQKLARSLLAAIQPADAPATA